MWWALRCWSKPQISELQSSEPISWKTTRRASQTLTHDERRVPFADAAGKWTPGAERANLVRPLLQTTRRPTAAQTTGIHQSVGVDRNWLARTGTRVHFHLVWQSLLHSAGILTLQQRNETELGRELFVQLFLDWNWLNFFASLQPQTNSWRGICWNYSWDKIRLHTEA